MGLKNSHSASENVFGKLVIVECGESVETCGPSAPVVTAATGRRHYLGDDGRAVVLRPGGGGALVDPGAAPVAPAAVRHPGRQQAGGAGGQLTAAGAN